MNTPEYFQTQDKYQSNPDIKQEIRKFPRGLKAKLPIWSLDNNFDLQGYIIGFRGEVKVIQPAFLRDAIKKVADQIANTLTVSPMLKGIQCAIEVKFGPEELNKMLPSIKIAKYRPNVLNVIYEELKQSQTPEDFIDRLATDRVKNKVSDESNNETNISDLFILNAVFNNLKQVFNPKTKEQY
ncbi:hypothetical protein IQ225_19225 [Synechocystis salina LEGE 06155]|nr:hypothetical protein [Synechocystis salina LEGE 06155]